jgi:hypothetical protein
MLTPLAPSDAAMNCPACGGIYLHHDEIKVFCRREDAETVTETTVSDLRCVVETTGGAGNPSCRRGGVTVQFWCETCSARPVLRIAQHKGSSLVSWDITEPRAFRVIDGGRHAE